MRLFTILFISYLISVFPSDLIAQSKILVTVKGLNVGDTALLRLQMSNEIFKFKYIGGMGNDIDCLFDSLPNGKWALGIDAKSYISPLATTFNLNNNTIASNLQLNKAPSDGNFSYSWQDDSSFVGHAQQAYINDVVKINVLGKIEKIPDDFNGINLLNTYGFLLTDSASKWTTEEAYRLYQTVSKLNFQKFGERDSIFVKAKIFITDLHIDKDISFETVNGISLIGIAREAFTYASPLVVTLDNIKGKFFSKRLYDAIVYYYTCKGTDNSKISEIANTRYGFQFLDPGSTLRTLMNETETNFQTFTSDEKLITLSMFEEYPDVMQRQNGLKYLVRRINGQVNPTYPSAAAIAWTRLNTIEFMESAFKSQDIQSLQRLVLHEKAHFFWAYTFDTTTKTDWTNIGDWYLDPSSASGWSTNNTTEFVSAYSHLKNPDEDMAESIAYYINDPDALKSRSIRKFEFVRDRIMKGTIYISIIRPDLTFQVYNLYPDYNYPGKIKRTNLEVIGSDTADKTVRLEIELTIQNTKLDGAVRAYTRFISSIGTIFDMYLHPTDNTGSILVGEVSLSKFSKSGFWRVDQITTTDQVGNQRYENNTNFGLKCFVNNPLEDVIAPLYIQNSLKLDSVVDKFVDYTGSLAKDRCGACADTLKSMSAFRFNWQMVEKNRIAPFGSVLARVFLPTLDTSQNNINPQPYSKDFQADYGEGIINDQPDSIKSVNFYCPIPDYYPSGYYSVSSITMTDQALNTRYVFFDKDTSNKNYFISPGLNNQRAIRDSMYFKTKYPDYKPPILDLNNIKIQANPTNLAAPNGETLFEMWLWIKDTSDYYGHASGFMNGNYTLRDPQGLEHNYSMQIDLGNLYYQIPPDSSIYGYKRYYFKTLLPVGSPAGLWGVSSLVLEDHAANKKYYNFVELVRFDVEQSKQLQVNPYVEIVGKKVNLSNVDSATVKIGCPSCKNQNYHLTIYSSMGGNSSVTDGKMTSDTIIFSNINLKGVNDGILYATAFILDSTNAMLGEGKSNYTKDTQIPINYNLTTNNKLIGISNLDSLIVGMNSIEIKSTNHLILKQKTVSSGGTSKIGDSTILIYNPIDLINYRPLNNSFIKISKSDFSNFSDGIIELKFISTDSMGNEGLPISQFIYKDTQQPSISLKNDSTVKLATYLSLNSNEYISNQPKISDFIVSNGTIFSIDKLNDRSFKIKINRICSDILKIQINSGALIDTVGNPNAQFNYSTVDSLIPQKPIINSNTNSLVICSGDSTVLTSSASNGNQWLLSNVVIVGAIGNNYTAKTSGNYSLVNTNNSGCSATSLVTTITVSAMLTAPTVNNIAYCQNASSAPLTATFLPNDTLRWYGTNAIGGTGIVTAPIPSTSTASSTDYFVSQYNLQGCESSRSKMTVSINELPIPPTVNNITYFQNTLAIPLTATALIGDSIRWYGINATGGTGSVTAPIPLTTIAGLTNYYVSQYTLQGCESGRAKLTVSINAAIVTTITSINPATVISGTTVTITGANLTGATAVSFGGIPASSFIVVSPSSITAIVGAGATGSILVTTPLGIATFASFNFVPTPTITASGSTTFITGGSVVLTTNPGTGYNYQWIKDSINIIGSNSATYTSTQSGLYSVSISLNTVSQVSTAISINSIFNLPSNNFKITITSAACKGSAIGSINITAAQHLNYTASVISNGLNKSYPFIDSLRIDNLIAGSYIICILVSGQTAYQQCFTAIITEPKDLSLYMVEKPGNQVIISLGGANTYSINLNGTIYTTTESQIMLPLANGNNNIVVTSDKACQGTIERTIVVSENILAYPNPFENILNLSLGKDDIQTALISIIAANGELIYNAKYTHPSGLIKLDLSKLIHGLYMLKISTNHLDKVIKIMKK